MSFEDVLNNFLDGKYNLGDFLTWLETGDLEQAPQDLKDSFDSLHLEALRLEIPLNLLNFLRDQTEPILTASQTCGQTPMKAHHPSKYDFNSPIKDLQASGHPRRNSGKNNRVQLFKAEKTSEKSDQFLVEKIESDPKMQILAERFSSVKKTPENTSNKSLKLNKSSRRSLDSCMNNSSKSVQKSPSGFTLADYEIKPAKSKKNKNKNRKSEPLNITNEPNNAPLIAVRRSPEKPVNQKNSMEITNEANDAPLIAVRKSPEKAISHMEPLETLAKMTPEKKQQFEKSNIWQQITQSLDKTPKIPNNEDLLEPCLENVSQVSKLDRLAKLYNLCIDLHLVPSLLVELYSIFQLLTVKDSKLLFEERKLTLLSSVHNCVYFSVKVLEQQVELLANLDRATLVFLVENPRLDSFAKTLKEDLVQVLSLKKIRHNSNNGNSILQDINPIRFTETDVRSTFPDNQTFQDFKKQRDMFYELLRKHVKKSDSQEFTGKVLTLLKTQEHPYNMQHFSKLFQNQLLSMSLNEAEQLNDCQQQQIDEQNLEADLKLLSELKQKMPPAKWSSLQARFLMRSQFGGPNPEPYFSGCQEFFRDFISCSTYTFITHLKHCLATSILDMNGITFKDEQPKNSEISRIILSLRILAKFLAFIETLPYANCNQNNLSTSLVQSKMEQMDKPTCLDLQSLIWQASRSHRLILTLPWIIEYCSILDPLSLKIPYFQQVFKTLIQIYKLNLVSKPSIEVARETSDVEDILSPIKKIQPLTKQERINQFNAFFLSIHLGWLFEKSSFPRDLFIQELDYSALQTLEPLPKQSLDGQTTLKLNLLFKCCPYVNELKVILCQFHTGFKASKVMPTSSVTTAAPMTSTNERKKKDVEEVKPENMQSALEANFFHNQPASVKRTVDTITERITSNFVRILKYELIPNESKMIMDELAANLTLFSSTDQIQDSIKDEMMSQVTLMATQSDVKIRKLAKDIIEDQLAKKVNPALDCLLPDDLKSPVINLCSSIIEKRIKLEAKKWMKVNMPNDYFEKVYKKEFEKLWSDHVKNLSGVPIKQSAVISSSIQVHPDLVFPISKILIQLKTETSHMLDGQPIRQKDLPLFLDQIEASYAITFSEATLEDKSILDVNVKGFESLSFDWTLALMTFHPHLMTAQVQDKIIGLWGGLATSTNKPLFSLAHPPTPLATLFSSRNLGLLHKSTNPNATWDKMEHFLGRLLKSSLILPIGLEDQCLVILKKEWPEDLLRRLGSCLKGVIDSWKKQGHARQREDLLNFTQEFLDWFAWLLTSLNEDDLEDNLDNFPELCL